MPRARYAGIVLWRLSLGLVAASAPSWSNGKELDRSQLGAAVRSVVKVEAIAADGSISLGSAVSLGDGVFVTNCHVTNRASRIDVLYTGRRWAVSGEAADPQHDLCAIQAPKLTDVPSVTVLSSRALMRGDAVAALGFSLGAGLSATPGEIKALHPLDGAQVIQVSAPFNSGASGGGLFDNNGNLIGILTFRLPNSDGYYFAMPADWILSLPQTSSFESVGPLSGPPPFWAHRERELPYFMQAATLEARRDWQSLINLTEHWASAETDNAEPWLMRGNAYGWLDRNPAAARAYLEAVKREPASALSWYRLGEAYLLSRDHTGVIDVYETLTRLDPELADTLAVRAGLPR